jgi:hypothetical protein
MKRLLLAVLLFSFFTSTQAQETGLTYGVGAGFNVSDMTYKAAPGFYSGIYPNPKFGFNGYLFVDVPIIKKFSVQTEIGYYGMGSEINNVQNGDKFQNETTSINYLTFSILPEYTFKGSSFSLFLGPSLGLKLNSSIFFSGSENLNEPVGGEATNDYTSIDVFGFVGMQYFFKNGLGMNVRYMQGLGDIAGPTYGDGKVFNRAFTFSLTYRLKAK